MSNFKSGSGDLDFGGNDNGDSDTEDESDEVQRETTSEVPTQDSETKHMESTDNTGSTSDIEHSGSDQDSTETALSTNASDPGYPYFVRRSNVGDERDKRLEIHVRNEVAEKEGTFRSQLAGILDTDEVSKTDAREFALLAAFEHPEQVAELMEDEGFGEVN